MTRSEQLTRASRDKPLMYLEIPRVLEVRLQKALVVCSGPSCTGRMHY